MQCKEWDDANSELFKESHDEAVHKNSYKSRLYELISASLNTSRQEGAVWRSRQHRVSIRLTASYAPAPLHGPLLHGKACHWILRLLHSPTNPVPLPPLKGTQDVTGFAFVLPVLHDGVLYYPSPVRECHLKSGTIS